MAHIEQARELGPLYLPLQMAAIVGSAIEINSLDAEMMHASNVLEIDANVSAGSRVDWNEEQRLRRPWYRL